MNATGIAEEATWGCRSLTNDFAPPSRHQISIVVPVFNEAPLIRSFLLHLRRQAPQAEIIVADGGSRDGTAEIAAAFCDRVVRSECNRARQMNAGARRALGDVLWFLHADTQVPTRALEKIEQALAMRNVAGGYFRIHLPRSDFVYRLTDCFAHYAGLLLRIRCGDHGIFCRREIFEELGGFPETPVMEDVEFFRMISESGRMQVVPQYLTVSPRRYELIGPWRLTISYGLIATLYALGAPLSLLARIYRQWCCRFA